MNRSKQLERLIEQFEETKALLEQMRNAGTVSTDFERLRSRYLGEVCQILEILHDQRPPPRLDELLRPLAARLVELDSEQGSIVIGLDPEMIAGEAGRLKARIHANGKFLEFRFKDVVLDEAKLAGDFFERIVSTFIDGKFEDPKILDKFGQATIWGLPLTDLPGFEKVTSPNEANKILGLVQEAVKVANSGGRLSSEARLFVLKQSALLDPSQTEEDLFKGYNDQDLSRLYIRMMEAFIKSKKGGTDETK